MKEVTLTVVVHTHGSTYPEDALAGVQASLEHCSGVLEGDPEAVWELSTVQLTAMSPSTAYRLIADAIPDELRGETLDEALNVLYDMTTPRQD